MESDQVGECWSGNRVACPEFCVVCQGQEVVALISIDGERFILCELHRSFLADLCWREGCGGLGWFQGWTLFRQHCGF